MDNNRNMKVMSGILGIIASLFFLVFLYQWAHVVIRAMLYISVALLALALASYLIIGNADNGVARLIPVSYLVVGLALVYAVVILAGGANTFLYLSLATAMIAGISFFSSSYATGYSHSTKKALKIH